MTYEYEIWIKKNSISEYSNSKYRDESVRIFYYVPWNENLNIQKMQSEKFVKQYLKKCINLKCHLWNILKLQLLI